MNNDDDLPPRWMEERDPEPQPTPWFVILGYLVAVALAVAAYFWALRLVAVV